MMGRAQRVKARGPGNARPRLSPRRHGTWENTRRLVETPRPSRGCDAHQCKSWERTGRGSRRRIHLT